MLEIRPILSALMQHKSRAVLIIIQIALTLAIVSNAVFIIDQRIKLINRDSGFPEGQLFGFSTVSLNQDDDSIAQAAADEILLRSIDGVINAVAINHTPIAGSGSSANFSLSSKLDRGEFRTGVYRADENALETLGVKLIQGRNFTAEEIHHGPNGHDSVIIVSKSVADKMFPDGDALGKTIYAQSRPSQIVGIVDKMHGFWVNWSAFEDNVLFPHEFPRGFQRFLVRTDADSREQVMAQVQEKMMEGYGGRVVTEPHTLESSVANSYQGHSAMMKILTILILLLLFITKVGIFGLSSFSVNQRTKQIGTRRALGANKWQVTRYFLVENVLMASLGLVIGYGLALGLNVWLVDLYGVAKLNNTYVLLTMFGIFCVSLLAVLIPALRAANVSPAMATRT